MDDRKLAWFVVAALLVIGLCFALYFSDRHFEGAGMDRPPTQHYPGPAFPRGAP